MEALSVANDSMEQQTLEGNYAAATEEALDRMITAAARRDVVALTQLENDGLIYPIYPNQSALITGCHGIICSKITFRYKNKAEEHWTVREALTKN